MMRVYFQKELKEKLERVSEKSKQMDMTKSTQWCSRKRLKEKLIFVNIEVKTLEKQLTKMLVNEEPEYVVSSSWGTIKALTYDRKSL